MKILMVGDYPRDERLGSAKVLFKLREEFLKLGHGCDFLFADDLGRVPTAPRLRWALGPILAARAIQKKFRRSGPYDVVDIASAEGFVFGLQKKAGQYRASTFISRSNGLEHLNYLRMLEDHRAGLLQKRTWRRVYYPAVRLSQVAAAARLADRLLLLNEVDRDFALKKNWQPPERISIVPHGVSECFLASTPNPDSPRGAGLLFCGAWTEVKGVHYLADAFSKLIALGTKINLTILGGGIPEAEIRSCFSSEAQNYLTIRPRVSEEEVMREYRRHDLLVFPSTYEGFGMVLLEAMSQGLPVIATLVGCAPAFIKHLKTGWAIAPRHPSAIVEAMETLLARAELRESLAVAGIQIVSNCSWKNSAVSMLACYAATRENPEPRAARKTFTIV